MGPLDGIKIVELAGIGPAPYGAMLLADLGADVIRIDRSSGVNAFGNVTGAEPPADLLARGRRSVAVDLKHPDGVATVLDLVAGADVVIEGFRPGVMERLGLGPDVCLARNPKVVFARMTGWGQDGPYAASAGHDINYIALAGALEPLGRAGEQPTPALNLIGDFGGGGMMLAMGVCAALVEVSRSGEGQVIDAAMIDGAASLMTMTWSFKHMGIWEDERGTNMLDTGAHFYDTYETSDGKYVSIGSIESQFYAELLRITEIDPDSLPKQMDRSEWPALKERFAEVFKTKTRDEWCALMEHTDVCFAPVLTMDEAPLHPHIAQRGTFTEVAGLVQPAPAPRFSRTPGSIERPPPHAGQHTDDVLAEWGLSPERIAELRDGKAIA
jgi:alpha-methylacyl-CoA racemase